MLGSHEFGYGHRCILLYILFSFELHQIFNPHHLDVFTKNGVLYKTYSSIKVSTREIQRLTLQKIIAIMTQETNLIQN